MADTTQTDFYHIFPGLSFNSISNNGSPRYVPETPINIAGQGGYGVVIKVQDHATAKTDGTGYTIRAMKLLKPDYSNKRDKIKRDFLAEIETLSKLEHPNLPRIYDWGEATCKHADGHEDEIPFYVMEYIEGDDLQKRLNKNEAFSSSFFDQLVLQTLSALSCCYENPNQIIHLDIKPDNILVVDIDSGKWRFVVTDFGKAKLMSELKHKRYDTVGGGIYRYVHPKLRPYLRKDKVPTEEFKKNGAIFDLYSLGRVYEDVLKHTENRDTHIVGDRGWKYLINDLCWNTEESFPHPQLQQFNTPSEAHETVRRLVSDTLINAFPIKIENAEKGVPIMRLGENESSPFPDSIKEFVDTPEFQKLRLLNQLGETDLVFPSATHSRFLHSKGTFYRCLFYISSLNRHPLFKYLFNETDLDNLLLIALLHDIGHYPYAHYFEEMGGLKKLNVEHEKISKKIFENKISVKKAILKPFAKKYISPLRIRMIEKLCGEQSSLGELIKQKNKSNALEQIMEGEGKYQVFKDIISGPIDTDKLDYLVRDSRQTGVSFGKIIDLERFYFSLTLDTEELPKIRLAVLAKGKSSVESIISARYNMFSEVYWHKTCRAATAMIKDALWLAEKNISQEEFECATLLFADSDFLLWLGDKIGNEDIAIDLLGGLKLGFVRAPYKRFRTYSKDWKEERKKDSYKNFIGKLGNNFTTIHKYKKNLVKKLNSFGAKVPGWQTIQNHQIIIDIPDVKQDLYPSLKVKYPTVIDGKQHYDLREISKFSEALYDSLATSTKKVRLFCHPKLYNQLINLKKLDTAISDAFE